MFCRNCGKKLEDNDVFCDSCGIKVIEENVYINKEDSKSKERLRTKIGIISAVVAVIAITWLSISQSSQSSKNLVETTWYNVPYSIFEAEEIEFYSDGTGEYRDYDAWDEKWKSTDFDWEIDDYKVLRINDNYYKYSEEISNTTWQVSKDTLYIGRNQYTNEE